MVVATQQITIAHSPDSDDAFMFYALAAEKIDTHGLQVKQVLKDIQSLNVDAKNGVYEVSAISFAVFPQIDEKYSLMPCGASMGLNYGPTIVSKRPLTRLELRKSKLAIPGKLTTAYLVARLYEPDLNVVEVPFDKIIDAVQAGEVDAGLLIHEGQLTYADLGLTKVVDLGEWWYEKFQLPLPLGGNVIRKDLGDKVIRDTTLMLQESIKYSLAHREQALEYAMQFARELNKPQADKFVGMYVNDLTVDYGDDGRKALRKLFELAFENRLIDKPVKVEFVEI
ncbi:MAG: MqnA/MqnD/SBP family protein [Candidatus Obscuribacterales bacterium]|jgi:1,4-dihydroxy-6-naphthoate synthase